MQKLHTRTLLIITVMILFILRDHQARADIYSIANFEKLSYFLTYFKDFISGYLVEGITMEFLEPIPLKSWLLFTSA